MDGQPQVFVDATGQMPQPAVQNRVLLIGDPFEQVPVVRDDDQRAGPGVEQVLGGGQHVGVDVVGGLVEEQHVGLGQQREHELQAPSLAAGEFADPRGQLAAAEAESLQQLGRGDLAALDLVAAGQPAEHVGDPVIGEVRPAGRPADRAPPAGRSCRA